MPAFLDINYVANFEENQYNNKMLINDINFANIICIINFINRQKAILFINFRKMLNFKKFHAYSIVKYLEEEFFFYLFPLVSITVDKKGSNQNKI